MERHSLWPHHQNWKRHWPVGIVAVIATIQLLVSFSIVIIHSAIVGIGAGVLCIGATPWFIMGFVCWAFFLACWISIFCVTCCNRSSVGCATYAMIKNILAFIFSAVLISFDSIFINDPTTTVSYNNNNIGCLLANSISISTDYPNLSNVMVNLAKGQLAGAVIILVLALVFVAIYIYVYIRALMDGGTTFNGIFPSDVQHTQTQFDMIGVQQPKWRPQIVQVPQGTIYPPESIATNPNPARYDNDSGAVVCPRCGAIVDTAYRF